MFIESFATQLSIFIFSCPFLNRIIYLLIELYVFFVHSGYKFFDRYTICNFLSSSWLSSQFPDGNVYSIKVSDFEEVQFMSFLSVCLFLFVAYTFGVISKKSLLIQGCKDLLLCFLLRVLYVCILRDLFIDGCAWSSLLYTGFL